MTDVTQINQKLDRLIAEQVAFKIQADRLMAQLEAIKAQVSVVPSLVTVLSEISDDMRQAREAALAILDDLARIKRPKGNEL